MEPLTLTAGTALLQYVDDLCLCARDESTCVTDTVTLLKHLAQEGHKVSLTKLQFVKQQITFLGHVITPNNKALSEGLHTKKRTRVTHKETNAFIFGNVFPTVEHLFQIMRFLSSL